MILERREQRRRLIEFDTMRLQVVDEMLRTHVSASPTTFGVSPGGIPAITRGGASDIASIFRKPGISGMLQTLDREYINAISGYKSPANVAQAIGLAGGRNVRFEDGSVRFEIFDATDPDAVAEVVVLKLGNLIHNAAENEDGTEAR